MKDFVRAVSRAAVRRILPAREAVGPLRLEPLSRSFGLDRGTPIDRHYIERFLAANSAAIRGAALEVGSTTYADRHRHQLSSVRVLHVSAAEASEASLIGDLARPETLPEAVADCFICTQTLPFIFDIAEAVRGAYRLLKPGGTLLATVSGISQVSRYDMDRWGDYWRFTPKSARMAMEHAFAPANVHIETYGNLAAAKALLDGLAVEDLPDPSCLDPYDPDYPVIIGIRALRPR